MSFVYHGRTKSEGCGHVKSVYLPRSPSKIFTSRFKGMLLLWFTISVIVCLCMYVLVKVLFWIAVWPFLGKRNCPFGFPGYFKNRIPLKPALVGGGGGGGGGGARRTQPHKLQCCI